MIGDKPNSGGYSGPEKETAGGLEAALIVDFARVSVPLFSESAKS